MKPVAIFRYSPTEGPGYFATYLDRQAIPCLLTRVDAGDPLPASIDAFSGLVFMGGPMSVNDDLPWIPPVLELIRSAVARDMPVLGHCLGGQLMSKALGGTVSRAPAKEIGWGEVQVQGEANASDWFGPGLTGFVTFHWHGETFTLPPGASCILSSVHCRNQAFVLGRNLALQCHVEMTEEMVKEWYALGADEVAASLSSPAVQDAEAASANLEHRVALLHAVADRLYGHWIEALPKQGRLG